MKSLTKIERENYYKYKRQGSNRRCSINSLSWSTSNSVEHEIAKFNLMYVLVKQDHKVITEAYDYTTGKRYDLVDLTTGEIYEFETDPKRAARHPKTINVRMVEKKRKC